jgi:hypothetical protein
VEINYPRLTNPLPAIGGILIYNYKTTITDFINVKVYASKCNTSFGN